MDKLRAAATQALEALYFMHAVAGPHKPAADAIAALREALSESLAPLPQGGGKSTAALGLTRHRKP